MGREKLLENCCYQAKALKQQVDHLSDLRFLSDSLGQRKYCKVEPSESHEIKGTKHGLKLEWIGTGN